jgi:hemoglobin-like flavoprotein
MAVEISESSGEPERRRLPDYNAWRDRFSAPDPPGSRRPAESAQDPPAPSLTDARLLKKSLAQIEPQWEKAMAYFYAILFVRNPELRQMFPLALEASRRQTFETLARYAWSCERPGSITGWLSELARSSRKLGVTERHFRLFNEAMIAAVRAFSGGSWSARTEAAWESALDHMYLPGQHVSVQVPQCPRVWREYSVANAPGPGGLLRLHVRAVTGGAVSGALVHQVRPGDTLILGPARGMMTAGAAAGGPVLCVAGGTGLAPIKAIVEAPTSPRHHGRVRQRAASPGDPPRAGRRGRGVRRAAPLRPTLSFWPLSSGP